MVRTKYAAGGRVSRPKRKTAAACEKRWREIIIQGIYDEDIIEPAWVTESKEEESYSTSSDISDFDSAASSKSVAIWKPVKEEFENGTEAVPLVW